MRKRIYIYPILTLSYILLNSTTIYGQNVGINTVLPAANLDVIAINTVTHPTGMQAPRMTLFDLTSKGESLYGPDQTGAIIYITDATGSGNTGQRININSSGYYYFTGSYWESLSRAKKKYNLGDIVHSFVAGDHDNWYLLDGRAVTSLPTKAATAAQKLGFTSSLPDSKDRVLKSKSDSESLAAVGGSKSIILNSNHLPALALPVSIKGNLADDGAHTHSVTNMALSSGGGHSHSITNGNLAAAGGHTHAITGTLNAGGSHTHTVAGNPVTSTNGNHSHAFYSPVFTTNPANTGATLTSSYNHLGNSGTNIWSMTTLGTHQTSTDGAHTHKLVGTLAAADNHRHRITGNLVANNAHTHKLDAKLASNDNHSHSITADLANAVAHSHTVKGMVNLPLGTAQPINNQSEYMVVNTFIYLSE